MRQAHLAYQDTVNLGSYYTPADIVRIAWEMIGPYLHSQTTVIDSACGYGDFLRDSGQSLTIGSDIDETAVDVAKAKREGVRFFQTNGLSDVSREKFGIPQQSELIVVGNPPYNDRTSFIRHSIKSVDFEVDADIACRDLGISFLRSYDKLRADVVCVLHPLSYLIKPANFRLLKDFAANYRLIEGRLVSSSVFPESAKRTPFPIVLALYERQTQGMDYNFIRAFRFSTAGQSSFCLADFAYITGYIDKYPKKAKDRADDAPLFSSVVGDDDESLFFWTLRDINALKRNRTFVEKYSANTIVIDKRKLDYYIYVDVFKRNLHRLPFYFGNCDVLIDDDLFKRYKSGFISDAVRQHPFLRKHFHQETLIGAQQATSELDAYFRALLGEHHV